LIKRKDSALFKPLSQDSKSLNLDLANSLASDTKLGGNFRLSHIGAIKWLA
jgi:hypothetical protein